MKTITYTPESKTFEKIVRAVDGRLFRVRFMVVERDGILRGKVISCEAVHELRRFKIYDLGFKNKTCCLPVWLSHQAVNCQESKVNSFSVSPYFNRFDFLTVIKIRAPAWSV